MPTGRPPKPTNLRVLEGNPGKRPLNTNEPKPRASKSIPAPPSTLGRDGKREWRRLAKELSRMNLLTQLDLTLFHMYCQAYDRWWDASREVKKNGMVVLTPNGYQMQSPYLSIANRAMEQMEKYLAHFGMSPASRTRVGVDPTGTDGGSGSNPVREFLYGPR